MDSFRKFLLLTYISVASIGTAILTPALPTIDFQWKLSVGGLEWIVTIFLLGYMLGQLIYAPIANRYGRLVAIRSGFSLGIIGVIICLFASYSNSYSLLLIGRFIAALGSACGLSCAFMLIYDIYGPDKSKHLLSFGTLSFTFGLTFAITGAGIITEHWYWPGIFWALLGYLILMLLSTAVFSETLRKKCYTSFISGYTEALKSWTLIVCGLVAGLTAIAVFCFSTEAPLISAQLLHLTPSFFGYWNNLALAGLLCSSFVAHFALKRLHPLTIIFWAMGGLLLAIASFFIQYMTMGESEVWFFLSAFMLYLSAGTAFPCGTHLAISAIKDRAHASSMVSLLYVGAAMISVLVMGYLPLSPFLSLIAVLVFDWALILILLFTLKRSFIESEHPDFSDSNVDF